MNVIYRKLNAHWSIWRACSPAPHNTRTYRIFNNMLLYLMLVSKWSYLDRPIVFHRLLRCITLTTQNELSREHNTERWRCYMRNRWRRFMHWQQYQRIRFYVDRLFAFPTLLFFFVRREYTHDFSWLAQKPHLYDWGESKNVRYLSLCFSAWKAKAVIFNLFSMETLSFSIFLPTRYPLVGCYERPSRFQWSVQFEELEQIWLGQHITYKRHEETIFCHSSM